MNVIRKKPLNLKSKDHQYFVNEYEREIIAKSTTELKNVFLTSQGYLFNLSLTIKPCSTRSSIPFLQGKKIAVSQCVKKSILKKNKKQSYAVIYDNWASGYFHWFGDVLPKLIAYKELLKATTIILPHQFNQGFYRDSLKYFPEYNFEFFQENEILFLPKAIHIGNIAQTGNYNEEVMLQLREVFTKNNQIQTPSKNIYISRSRAPRRKVINEEELLPILKKYNFEVVHFEDKTLKEQIEIMSQTKNLISIHGAGLTNMLFIQKNKNVLEFKLKSDYTNLCYFSLASSLDLNYYYQLADSEVKDQDTLAGNFIINKELLEENIQNMLKNK